MTLNDIISLVLKNLKYLIIFTVLGAVIGYGCAAFIITPMYTTQGSVYVLPKESEIKTQSDFQMMNSYVKNYLVLFTRKPIKEAAAQSLGMTYAEFNKAKIEVSVIKESTVLELKVTTDDPEKSANIANALLNEFQTAALEKLNAENVNILENADIPSGKSAPDNLLFSFIVALFALVLTFGIVAIIWALDNTIKTSDDIKNYLQLPVLSRFVKIEDKAFFKAE